MCGENADPDDDRLTGYQGKDPISCDSGKHDEVDPR